MLVLLQTVENIFGKDENAACKHAHSFSCYFQNAVFFQGGKNIVFGKGSHTIPTFNNLEKETF